MTPPCNSKAHIEGLRLTDLKFAAAFSVWCFRALATGHNRCPPVLQGFERAFGEKWEYAYHAMQDFVHAMGTSGRRTIKLSTPGCLGVTSDEVSLISVLYAAQKNNPEETKSHLCWLLASSNTTLPYHAATHFALILQTTDMNISCVRDTLQKSALAGLTNHKTTQYGGQNVRTLH